MPATSGSAKRYAEAIFDIAKSKNSFDRWSADLQAIAAVEEDDKLAKLLDSPAIDLSAKKTVLAEALPDLSSEASNLVKLLLHKGRLRIAPGIATHYRRMLNNYRGIATAEVTSAVALSSEETEAVAAHLSALTGQKVLVETSVDPAIMGGIVAQIGDQLIDASVRGRLEALKRRLATAG